MLTDSELSYRQAAAAGATHIGLLLVVYDALADDLRRAAAAVGRGDISARCDESNHAILLLGHLESWTGLLDDAELELSLHEFYAHLRSQILKAQVQPQSEVFQALANLVIETRAVWQKKESLTRELQASSSVKVSNLGRQDIDASEGPSRFSWSA